MLWNGAEVNAMLLDREEGDSAFSVFRDASLVYLAAISGRGLLDFVENFFLGDI